MRQYYGKRLLLLALVGMGLVLPRGMAASAAEPAAEFMVSVQAGDAKTPAHTYDDFRVTQVRRDGDSLVISGVLTNGKPQERANVQVHIPTESRPNSNDLHWQELYARQREPRGQ
jgi:hypothetical protein